MVRLSTTIHHRIFLVDLLKNNIDPVVSALSGLSGGSIRGAGGTHPLLDGGDGSVRWYSFFSDRMV